MGRMNNAYWSEAEMTACASGQPHTHPRRRIKLVQDVPDGPYRRPWPPSQSARAEAHYYGYHDFLLDAAAGWAITPAEAGCMRVAWAEGKQTP